MRPANKLSFNWTLKGKDQNGRPQVDVLILPERDESCGSGVLATSAHLVAPGPGGTAPTPRCVAALHASVFPCVLLAFSRLQHSHGRPREVSHRPRHSSNALHSQHSARKVGGGTPVTSWRQRRCTGCPPSALRKQKVSDSCLPFLEDDGEKVRELAASDGGFMLPSVLCLCERPHVGPWS